MFIVRLLGRFIKAAPHLFSIDGNRWIVSSCGGEVGTKLVEKRLKAGRLYQPKQT